MGKRYIHLCTMCSCDFEDDSRTKYICPQCEIKIQAIKKLKMLDRAEYDLTHFKGRMRAKRKVDLSKEVAVIRTKIINGIDTFSSKPELIVAIQLEHRRVNYETQKNIAGKRVDFYLPEIKIVLEIDGELYHTDENKTFLRDRAIMHELGEEWEIVHIEVNSVPRYTWNLHEALPFIITQRNEQGRFRDSRSDTYFLEQYYQMQMYMRGNR